MSGNESTDSLDFVGSRQKLPQCHSRHAWDDVAGTFFCSHPRVHAQGDIVSGRICASCNFWQQPPPERPRPFPALPGIQRAGPCVYLGKQTDLRECPSCRGNVKVKVFACDHELHEETTVRECQRCYDYEQQLSTGTVRKWAVGITTAPRPAPTLERTLDSLQRAGWRQPVVFAEPDSPLPPLPNATVVERQTRLGAWPNTYLALLELYMRSPDADAYFLLQDDVTFCRNLRPYLESVLWPQTRIGVASLYCSSGYRLPGKGFAGVPTTDGLLGALAMIFPAFALRSFVSDREVVAHRLRRTAAALSHVDVVVGRWASRCRLPAVVHSPSLAQHIGETSSLWSCGRSAGIRRADDFPGEPFDALSLLPPSALSASAAPEKPEIF